MFAIVEILGKQYKVSEGEVIQIDKLDKKKDEKVVFEDILLIEKDGNIEIGKPKVKNSSIEAVVVDHRKDKKVIVFKHKPKKRYHRTYGHRQKYSFIKIEKILA